MSTLIKRIRDSVIGSQHSIQTPFGLKPLIYADYTASGRSLSFIENFIRDRVLAYYANTHTETSFTGAQSTKYREQARQEISSALNCSSDDLVIFCGPGATAAINKLIDILNLRLPRDLAQRYDLEAKIPSQERPVVFIGPYEHHSNELPWRESIADVLRIPLTESGQIDQEVLEQQLLAYASRPLLIGSFSAASNVTGIKSDVPAITSLLKSHGALALWDYAAAGPYVDIDMNGDWPLDAVFLSPHKFVGGPGTPGLLVLKKSIVKNTLPTVIGGGTVQYVSPEGHRFIADPERREEGGTPAIVESIRAGLVFKLKQEVGAREIERREKDFIERAMLRFKACPELEILGNTEADRLAIISLRFKHGNKDLHYGFVASLLNDLFGIQVRGGCSCAGPYAHSLLGMSRDYSKAIEAAVEQGTMILRPGWLRLNFNYFIAEPEFEYLLRAVELVAQHGWRLLPCYHLDPAASVWRFQGQAKPALGSLPQTLADYVGSSSTVDHPTFDLATLAKQAESELCKADRQGTRSRLELGAENEDLRWFILPQEASAMLELMTAPELV